MRQITIPTHWIKYPVTKDSEPIDKRIDPKTKKSTGLGYLNEPKDFPRKPRTPIQQTIEQLVSTDEIILPHIGKDDKTLRNNNKGETINRRNSYHEQFYEPHASKGGRLLDLQSHIKNEKLFHFNKPANGSYIWVIDENKNFILGNRGEIYEDGSFTGIIHDMYQMPPDLGTGQRHEKIDKRKTTLPHSTAGKGLRVYGAGEVQIEKGLIAEYNADSGHYAKLIAKPGEPHEPDNFVRQSIEAFKLFSKKANWKEIKNGAKYISQNYDFFKTP